jgi:putative ABC transport system permease protein
MALGAGPRHVARTVGAPSLLIVGVGIIVGTIGAGFAARWLDTILFGVSPADPWILAGSGTLLLIVATIAMAKPVTRAVVSIHLKHYTKSSGGSHAPCDCRMS